MGPHKKKFLIWRNVNNQAKILSHTSIFESIFSKGEIAFKNNFELVIKDASSEVQKKKNLCRKLINNSLFVQHHAYMIWKEAYHVDDINIKKKQTYITDNIKSLANIFNSYQNKKVIQAIGVFRRVLEMRNFEEYDYYKSYKNKQGVNFYENLKRIQSNNKLIFINALKTNQA